MRLFCRKRPTFAIKMDFEDEPYNWVCTAHGTLEKLEKNSIYGKLWNLRFSSSPVETLWNLPFQSISEPEDEEIFFIKSNLLIHKKRKTVPTSQKGPTG